MYYFLISNIWKLLDWIIPKVHFSSKSKMSIIFKPLFQILFIFTTIEKPKLHKTDEGLTAEVERKKREVLG